MSTLTKQKREAYKKILLKENQGLSEEKLDEIINFLYDLACTESKTLHDESNQTS
jgi:hypothetical protein